MAPSVLQTTKMFSHMSIQSFVLSTLGNLFTLYPNLESPVNLTRAHGHANGIFIQTNRCLGPPLCA